MCDDTFDVVTADWELKHSRLREVEIIQSEHEKLPSSGRRWSHKTSSRSARAEIQSVRLASNQGDSTEKWNICATAAPMTDVFLMQRSKFKKPNKGTETFVV